MTGRILARFTSYSGLLDALRARLDELGISHGTFDRIAGLAEGYTNKVLKPDPVRYLLPTTLQFFLEGAAVELCLVELPEETEKLRGRSDFEPIRWSKKRVELQRDGYLTPAQIKRATPRIVSVLAKRARAKGVTMLTSQQRSEIASYAAFCRWRPKHKRKRRPRPAR